jgi:hypothetical protein
MTVSCAVGHYCPSGTVSSTSNPCPAGTFTNSANLVNSGQCTQCPRVIPVVLAQLLRLGQIVLLVEFVLVGQALVVTMCPAGTSQCTPCSAGSYCSGGSTSISGPCQAGYYCPVMTGSATSFPCLAGTYSTANDLVDASQCTDCPPAGSFCVGGLSYSLECPAGTYSSVMNTVSSDVNGPSPHCMTCPAGVSWVR